jgi:hypothetical protein
MFLSALPDGRGTLMDRPMQVFLAERATHQMTDTELRAVHTALTRASSRLGGGTTVRYIRSTYDRSRGLWLAAFTADDLDAVAMTIDLAQLPPVSLTEAVELSTDDSQW